MNEKENNFINFSEKQICFIFFLNKINEKKYKGKTIHCKW